MLRNKNIRKQKCLRINC